MSAFAPPVEDPFPIAHRSPSLPSKRVNGEPDAGADFEAGDCFAVLALDGSGTVHQTYAGPVYVAGNLSFGKIAIDDQYLYVAGQDQLTRFLLGDPNSGSVIYTNNQVFDAAPLPSGDLLV